MPFKKQAPEEPIGNMRKAEIVLAQGGTTAAKCKVNGRKVSWNPIG